MTNNKPFHMVKLDEDLYQHVIKHGKYGESFSDVLKRLLEIRKIDHK